MATHRDVFPFFDLPAELREWTLSYMCREKPISLETPYKNYFNLLVRHAPRTELLLVSRQFSKEYRDQARKHTSFAYQDHRQCEFNVPEIPEPLKAYPLSDVCLLAFRHNTFYDIERHVAWLKQTLPKVSAKSVEVKLYCETDDFDGFANWPSSVKQERAKALLEELVALPGAAELKLYWYDGTPGSSTSSQEAEPDADADVEEEVRKNIGEVIRGPQNLIETWSKADGWKLERPQDEAGEQSSHTEEAAS